ncbi:MAG: MarR family transcriptional regulator [Hyphomicrobiaceae bacterium]|nr:MarR family transcriptional regulator [Hyphomicrobiaceae bacterium]
MKRRDVTVPVLPDGPHGAPDTDRDRLIACAELLFFAYRDFINDPDKVLDEYGFGRAHHRVLHFVNRNPGLRVADLLDILKITKQSLARVLKQLIDEGFIAQRSGKEDRRERLLHLTAKGTRLAEKLANLQIKRIGKALDSAGTGAGEATRRFLFAMIAEKDRDRVEHLIRLPNAPHEKEANAPASSQSQERP